MKMSRIAALLLLCLVGAASAHAQTGMLLKRIAGQQYYTYEIQNKETLYGISQKVQVPQDILLKYNPWAQSKLEKKQLLLVPVDAVKPQHSTQQPFTITTAQPVTTHTIAAGENICTIAKRYNASVEGILASNPHLSPSGYVVGQSIRVVPGSAMPFAYTKQVTVFTRYEAQKGDTYSGLAQRYGITVADMQALNPANKEPKRGKMLVVPAVNTEQRMGDMATIELRDLEDYYLPRLDALYTSMLEERRNSNINIGIILPFQLHKSAPPKQAYLYTDFYKGFLIALDSLKSSCPRHINVKVYDTQHNLNVTDSLLSLPEMRDLDVIIAPSEPKQLERINNFGKENNIDVLNCFSTKNDDLGNNPNIYQVNAPTRDFTTSVLRWFDEEFADCEVIYLDDYNTESKDIYSELRTHIAMSGIASNNVTVNNELSYDQVSRAMNPGVRYLFIPSSSSKGTLKKIVRALKQAKDERIDCDMALLAYPEYVLYLKEYQEDLQTIDSYMFSRFFNAKGYRTRDFNTLYRRWFGGEPLVSYPDMALLGYDTAMFLVQSLCDSGSLVGGTTYKGIQTGFRFERESGSAGYVNQAINVVHFTPQHTIVNQVR